MNQPATLYNDGVTIAKAIAIILMVLGHSGCPEEMNHFLGILRMPLFFFMSGYCFKTKYMDDGKKYLKRRVTGVYWPYVKWGICFLLLHNLLCSIGIYSVSQGSAEHFYSLSEILHRLATIIICLCPEEQLIGGYWFIHDLFWGSLLFYFSLKLIKNIYIVIFILFLMAMSSSYQDIQLSYFLYPRTVLASVFISAGFAFKEGRWHFERSWLYIFSTTALILGISFFWYSNFLEFSWQDIPPYTIFAILGSLMLFGIGENINKLPTCKTKSLLIYIGKRTFNVLTWHMLSFKIVSLLLIYIYSLEWSSISQFPVIGDYALKGWCMLYFTIGVVIPIVGTYGYDKIKSYIKAKYNVNKAK